MSYASVRVSLPVVGRQGSHEACANVQAMVLRATVTWVAVPISGPGRVLVVSEYFVVTRMALPIPCF